MAAMSEPGSTPEETGPRRIAGRYRLTSPLGSGAMGTVWAGYDEVLHRSVAIKELRVPPGVPQGEMVAMRERMMREARTLGGLSHPNVITLYDVVDVSGDPFVVMELLPSRNLSEVIGEQGRLGPGQTASVGLAMSAALQAAHRAGITHRDVKPGNVLVAHDGRIKLTDFGIARKTSDVTMTQTGLVLGSPAYIAPEVASGLPVTPAADLWGLGATLFAAVEARPPYDVDGDPVKTVTAVVHAQVPRVRASGPLGEVITALMVKDPERRMPLAEVRRRLRPLLADPDDPLFPGSVDAYSPAPGPSASRLGEAVDLAGGSGASASMAAASGTGFGRDSDAAPRADLPTDSRADARSTAQPRSRPAPAASGQRSPGPAPLAADPGPLPGGRTESDPGRSGRTDGATAPVGAGDLNRAAGSEAMRGRPSWQPPPPPLASPRPPPRPPVATSSAVPAPAPTSSAGRRWVLPLVLAGALAVALGATGGWVGTRMLVGQSPTTTSAVSPADVTATTAMTTHVDSAQRYGGGALNFTASVPQGWEEYRVLGSGGEQPSVRFASPDGSREARVDKLVGSRVDPVTPDDFVSGLTPDGLGVARVDTQRIAPDQVRYRIVRAGGQGNSTRYAYARLTQAGDDLWVEQLIVPGDQAGTDTEQLFTSLTQGFRP
jgi:serine/threonine protein kinase